MQPLPIFYDRRGNVVTPSVNAIIKPRRGVFALVHAISDDAILLVYETLAPDVPQLPGGGIEQGEDLDPVRCRREWGEETGLPFEAEGPFGKFNHIRGFQSAYGEFWIYDQTFFLYRLNKPVTVGQKWRNSEEGEASWEYIADLPKLDVHRGHWCGIAALLPELERDGVALRKEA